MDYLDKIRLYRAGHYVMPAPPVHTYNWTESDWINFIDQRGKWRDVDMLSRILSTIKTAYIQAIYFTDTGDVDQPGHDIELSADAIETIERDVAKFWDQISGFNFPSGITYDQLGHDFWLTRNGHGTGFWDRPEVYGEQLADQLTAIAESFGEQWTYESDNGEMEIN